MGEIRRRTLIALAILCFAAAFALTPSEVRSGYALASPPMPAQAATVLRAALATIEPAGDPFVPRVADDPPAPPPPAPAHFAFPANLAPLPPNAGAAFGGWPGSAPAAPITVTAVVVGAHPIAIVVDATGSHLVMPGDRIAGTTIAAIDDGGVTLSDRRRLALPALAASAP